MNPEKRNPGGDRGSELIADRHDNQSTHSVPDSDCPECARLRKQLSDTRRREAALLAYLAPAQINSCVRCNTPWEVSIKRPPGPLCVTCEGISARPPTHRPGPTRPTGGLVPHTKSALTRLTTAPNASDTVPIRAISGDSRHKASAERDQ